MREGQPSITAMMVSFARGVASLPGPTPPIVDDPFARRFLPAPVGATLGLLGRAAARASWVRPAITALATPLVDHVALRTAAIDAALDAALRAGMGQVVVVGAGLDARAWRTRGANEAVFFELDHPVTQRFKRRKVAGATLAARDVRFVDIDFSQQSLADRLEDAGHRTDEATFWIWEGVTMYLPLRSITATLRDIRRRSSVGSRLAVTYARPELASLPGFLDGAVHAGFQALGEPLEGLVTSEEMRELLEATGFAVLSDAGDPEWAERFYRGRRPPVMLAERLAVAEAR